ncbi:MAG TPA: caspase family protein [Kofleriaceae bacterium]
MRGIAVCCGFNNYEFHPLDRAENDAALLYTKLAESGTFNDAPELIGKGAVFTQQTSADAILAAFTRAATSSAELVWFSFSGHAIVSGEGELRLLLPDWRRDASEASRRRYSIGAGQIEYVLRSYLASKKFVVVLDTCHSGAFGHAAVTRDLTAAIGDRIAGAGAVVISSCTKHQLASDGAAGSQQLNGEFSAAVIGVFDDRLETGAPLSVLQLFLEAKARTRNGQLPTLYASGLTDDFSILGKASPVTPSDGIVPLSAEVPATLKTKLSTLLSSLVQIRRQQRVGLIHAERQLEHLAAEFYRYGDDTFIVPGYSSNVAEAIDNARAGIVGCTTPAYIGKWHLGGLGLLGAIGEFIAQRGGRGIRLFFVPDDFESRVPGLLDIVRDHVVAGVLAVIVNVDSFGPAVLQEVFKDPAPSDLSALECTFVDGNIFLKTHFAANGELKIEMDQRPDRSQHEYKTYVRPFLASSKGSLFGAYLEPGHDDIVLRRLLAGDICELKHQLETDLGVTPEIDAIPAITPGAARARAGGSRAASYRRPSP